MADPKFIQEACDRAVKAVSYAVMRNIPELIDDLRRDQQLANETGDEIPCALPLQLKLDFYSPRDGMATIRVTDVAWVRRRRHHDTDFPEEEIDFEQPTLPGFDPDADSSAPAGPAPSGPVPSCEQEGDAHFGPDYADVASLHNLVTVARALGKDIFMPCDWKDLPNAEKHILRYSAKTGDWKPFLVPEGKMGEVIDQAVDNEHIVYVKNSLGAILTLQSEQMLKDAGGKVVLDSGRLAKHGLEDAVPQRYVFDW